MNCSKLSPFLSVVSFAVLFSSMALSLHAQANELMTKPQYADYSVRYQCAQLRFNHDLAKQEQEILEIEAEFGLNDDNFEAFDELVQAYERDDTLLDEIRSRVTKECI